LLWRSDEGVALGFMISWSFCMIFLLSYTIYYCCWEVLEPLLWIHCDLDGCDWCCCRLPLILEVSWDELILALDSLEDSNPPKLTPPFLISLSVSWCRYNRISKSALAIILEGDLNMLPIMLKCFSQLIIFRSWELW